MLNDIYCNFYPLAKGVFMQKELASYYTKQLAFGYEIREEFDSIDINTLTRLLSEDLDFHNYKSSYATHDFHAFPAKFPPQLPLKFILSLTKEGDTVLDPMSGSGTTVVEAFFNGRKGIGFDIDPLALKIARVKTTYLDEKVLFHYARQIVNNALYQIHHQSSLLKNELNDRWDSETRQFIENWFAFETQIELIALINEISKIDNEDIRNFFELVLSATIITKSGGVSLALDLAHTRPHKAKVIISRDGQILLGKEIFENMTSTKPMVKKLRSPIEEFQKRATHNIRSLTQSIPGKIKPDILPGNAQCLPLEDDSIDLIVTSPPYASNAIDYMRAHKFSLVWLGHSIHLLGSKRKEYIGAEDIANVDNEKMPFQTSEIISALESIDRNKSKVILRYYSEMKRVLVEMYRVLKPNKSAIVIVGNSFIRGLDIQTPQCLSELGIEIGFSVAKIGIRKLDRNKRMMPAGHMLDKNSQIQQRMHEEYVIGFFKS